MQGTPAEFHHLDTEFNNSSGLKPVIKIRDIEKTYGEKTVISNISLDIHPQTTTVLLGHSGSGIKGPF